MYRPAGHLEWSLGCTTPRTWHFIGSVNSEKRCIETAKKLHELRLLGGSRFLKVHWPASPYRDIGELKTATHISMLNEIGIAPQVLERDLLATVPDFMTDAKGLQSSSVVLDITSMPKRFFFFYLKSLLADPSVKDLLITYCYGNYGPGPLSENHEDWDVLPTFRGKIRSEEERAKARLAVNVGFMPKGLEEHLRTNDSEQSLFLILPFPARVSSTRRVWKSAMEIHSQWHGPPSSVHIRRIAPDDISGAFDLICSIAGGSPLSLAPFGPKPISAAMCIYASLTDSPVYYAQPKWYSPEYTTEPELDDRGAVKISAHWIKCGGKCLYSR